MADMKSAEGKAVHEIVARDIMSRFAITIFEDEPLLNAAHLMMRFKISGMPVVARSGEIKGIITATDLFRIMGEIVTKKLESGLEVDANIMVKNVMTKSVSTIHEETSLIDAIILMWAKKIHTLPVVEDGKITGIIGRRDLLNAFYHQYRLGDGHSGRM